MTPVASIRYDFGGRLVFPKIVDGEGNIIEIDINHNGGVQGFSSWGRTLTRVDVENTTYRYRILPDGRFFVSMVYDYDVPNTLDASAVQAKMAFFPACPSCEIHTAGWVDVTRMTLTASTDELLPLSDPIFDPAPEPEADAGPDQTVDEGVLVTLDGSQSTGVGDTLSYGCRRGSGFPRPPAARRHPVTA